MVSSAVFLGPESESLSGRDLDSCAQDAWAKAGKVEFDQGF